MRSIKMLMMAALTILSVSVFSQDTSMHKSNVQKMKMKYSCPMHSEVTSDKPGKCSKCGMDMKATANTKMKKNYACPMHPEVTSDKPGKCSKCGMDLEPIKSKAKKG